MEWAFSPCFSGALEDIMVQEENRSHLVKAVFTAIIILRDDHNNRSNLKVQNSMELSNCFTLELANRFQQ